MDLTKETKKQIFNNRYLFFHQNTELLSELI